VSMPTIPHTGSTGVMGYTCFKGIVSRDFEALFMISLHCAHISTLLRTYLFWEKIFFS
jgi:hypothetical protein